MKSYVGMMLCPLCEEPVGVALDRSLEETLPEKFVDPTAVCDTCREKYLDTGTMIVCPETGQIVIVTDEAFERTFTIPIPESKVCFADPDVMAIFPEPEVA